MKAILFCNLPYAIAILKPLAQSLEKRGFSYLWYVPKALESNFPYHDMPHTSDIRALEDFQSDAIFVPGNDVPWYLRGVKVQVFHGLAGEKKGHFRIRDYFDLYLTQGPYFTERFQTLAKEHQNFEVVETGWCKLDPLFTMSEKTIKRKASYLKESQADKIILYAPTFSPSLTSAERLLEHIQALSQKEDTLIIIKFHDKMDKNIQKKYAKITNKKCIILEDKDVTPALQMADIMISDTSSVVYEFLLLDKPVITLNSHSENIYWEDIQIADMLAEKIDDILYNKDAYNKERGEIIKLYHPYHDGQSAHRMLDATQTYIKQHGVPTKRKIPLLRKLKMIKAYGQWRW